jgi:hypothetical protein
MDDCPIPIILKLNFPFFLRIFMFSQTGPAVSCTDRHLIKKLNDKLLFPAGTALTI